MEIKLQLPLRDIFINQPFGVNYLDFYTKMGMKGHNGVDFKAKDGCPVYASHDGTILWAGTDGDGGISVQNISSRIGLGFYTINYHLKSVNVKVLDEVKAGALIGWADNTGKYTTGDHDHFGLKETMDGGTINKDNGYGGAIDPAPYFNASYNGFPIGNKDWDKPRCYHRYYRVAKRDLKNEMKVALYMATRLKRLPNNEEINAAIWGGWAMEDIINPSMYQNWSQLTKDEFINQGLRPFV